MHCGWIATSSQDQIFPDEVSFRGCQSKINEGVRATCSYPEFEGAILKQLSISKTLFYEEMCK